ncbi:MAG TPA: helix-hairpin-helix domain-containing protein [Elainellaceae cyanobacterium]
MELQKWLKSAANLQADLKARLRPLQTQLRRDPYYRFQSIEEVQIAASLGVSINVNQASVDDWLRLPGLSIHQARSLTDLTQAGIQFHCLDDIAAALNLPIHRLRPLEPILRFYYYAYAGDRTSAIRPVPLNTASVDALIQIPMLEADLARAIVWERQQRGAYRNLADLQRRLSISSTIMSDLMHHVRCEP